MILGKQSRRRFFKHLMSLSAFGAASVMFFRRRGKTVDLGIGAEEACAMINPEYATTADHHEMKIEYFGMSCFLITSGNGTRIITDPFFTDKQVLHPQLGKEPADIVTVSCGNYAHCYVYAVGGMPYVYRIKAPTELMGVKLRGVSTRHLEMKEIGPTRPDENVVMCLEVDGIRICHLGALGHVLSDGQVKEIGTVDILMLPVGGVSTVPLADCDQVCSQLNPKVIIPMHYRSERCVFPSWATLGDFLKGRKNVIDSRGLPERYFSRSTLPTETQILWLGYPT